MYNHRKGAENDRNKKAYERGVWAAANNYHEWANPYPRRSILFGKWEGGVFI